MRFSLICNFSAVDACGNEAEQVFTVLNIIDNTAPTLPEIPEDVTISCDEEVPAAESLTAIDDCSDMITAEPEDETSEAICGVGYTITRTWTFTDPCGNSSIAMQTITVEDDTTPTLPEAPEDLTLECDEDVPAGETLTATFGCSEPVAASPTDEITPGECANSYSIIRTWTFADSCGEEYEVTQNIEVTDSTPPVIILPEDVSVDITCEQFECGIDTGLLFAAGLLPDDEAAEFIACTEALFLTLDVVPTGVEDNCDENIEYELVDLIPIIHEGCVEYQGGTNVRYSIICTFAAEDACGNQAEQVQTYLNFIDNTAPMLPEVPEDMTISCGAEVPAGESLTATDDCLDPITVEPEDEIEENICGEGYTITRTWTFSDPCGNTSVAMQTITVEDNSAPVINCPEDVTHECNQVVDYGMATVEEGCSSDVSLTFSDESLEDDCGNITITRTWTATDACGNSDECTQMISIVDTTGPILFLVSIETSQESQNSGGGELPVDYTVECDNIPSPAVLDAFDNCSSSAETTVMFEETQTSDEGCNDYIITRTWTAIDACGNETEHVQNITVEDTTAPVLEGLPSAELTINCQDEHPDAPVVMASDNCDELVTVEYVEEYYGFEPDPEAYENCEGIQPLNAEADWALALFDMPGFEDGESYYNVIFSQVSLYEDSGDGLEGLLTGTFYNQTNPNGGWHVNIPLTAGVDWETWSLDPDNEYKDDFNLAGDAYLDWTYYIINSEGAYLEGWGDYEGSYLEVSHAPSNETIGWQHGVGANNVGPHLGLGGWLFYDGQFIDSSQGIDEAVNGAGDVALDLNCCPTYIFTRTWTSADCSGNETSFTQEITVLGTDAQAAQNCPADFNFDGQRNTSDLTIFLIDYGCFSGNCQCDLTGDGFTTSGDLSEFLNVYGVPCENAAGE